MTAESLFLDKIETYDELSGQIVSRVAIDPNTALSDVELSSETVADMSDEERFKYRASSLYSYARAQGSSIDRDVARAEHTFEKFKSAFDVVFPHHPVREALEDEHPIVSVVESGRLEDFMKLVQSLPVDFPHLQESFEYLYLNETGAIDEIRRIPEDERRRLAEMNTQAWKHSPSFVRAQLLLRTSDQVLKGLVEVGLLPANHPISEIRIDHDEDPRKTSFSFVQQGVFKNLKQLGLTYTLSPGKRITIHDGYLKASTFGSVTLSDAYRRNFREFYDKKPVPLDEDLEGFVFRCLDIAIDRAALISRMSSEDASALLDL